MSGYLKAGIAVPPGDTLAEQLEDRHMTKKELSIRTGLTEKHIIDIIKGRVPLSNETALKLENVLGIPASFWNNLEMIYSETLARIKAEKEFEQDYEIAREIPYSEMANKGWVDKTRDIKIKVINLRKYFGIASLEYLSQSVPVAFRKSEVFEASNYSLATWLRQGEIQAEKIETASFDKKKILDNFAKLRSFTLKEPEEFCSEMIDICSACGIALVFVPHIAKSHANGAVKWLAKDKVLLQMSVKGRYADIFWFTFFHELGHIYYEHSKKNTIVECNDEYTNDIEQEKKADKFAMESLIPTKYFNEFMRRVNLNGIIDEKVINDFASELNIHPGIVVGRLQHEKYIEFNQFNELRTKFQIM